MTQTRQLFGTDGIRGVAGEFPLTVESTFITGRALGHDLIRSNPRARVLIGQDTRESSRWIADRVAAGLSSRGVEVASAGVITTPGVAYLARSRGFDAGIVISASHNPWTDNGIKVFSGDGYKLPDAQELAIEKEIFALLQNSEALPAVADKQTAPTLPGDAALRRAYIEWLGSNVSADLSRLRVLVDCANGAATAEAPELLRGRVQVSFLHAAPDGKNINENCGALHPENVAKAVAENKGQFDLGITFDGDADRALFSDADGKVVNGDGVLLAECKRERTPAGVFGRHPAEVEVHTLDEHVGAGHEKTVAVGNDCRVVPARPGAEVRLDALEQRQLPDPVDAHAVSMARRRRVACSGSDASPTARTTHARRIPSAVSCPRLASSIPPIAKTGMLSALVSAATPAGPITCFCGLSGVANAGPQPA